MRVLCVCCRITQTRKRPLYFLILSWPLGHKATLAYPMRKKYPINIQIPCASLHVMSNKNTHFQKKIYVFVSLNMMWTDRQIFVCGWVYRNWNTLSKTLKLHYMQNKTPTYKSNNCRTRLYILAFSLFPHYVESFQIWVVDLSRVCRRKWCHQLSLQRRKQQYSCLQKKTI